MAQDRAAVRTLTALEYRIQGYTYQEIASLLDESVTAVHQQIRRAILAIRNATRETAKDLLELEMQRLDMMQRALWPLAVPEPVIGGISPMPDLDATAAILRIMDRRSRYMGLDKPVKLIAETGTTSHVLDVLLMSDDDLAKLEQMHVRQLELAAAVEPTKPEPE